jgi:hypothetical protein
MTEITSLNYIIFKNIPLYGLLAVLGGFLLQFTMGSFYSFGNMMTYMTSYMRAHGSPNITYEDFVVVQSTWSHFYSQFYDHNLCQCCSSF